MESVVVYYRPPERRRVLLLRSRASMLAVTAALAAFAGGVMIAPAGRMRALAWVQSGVIVALFALFQLRLAKRAVARMMTYQLTLGPNLIRIVCQGLLPTEVLRTEVTRIVESSRYLRVSFAGKFIAVPRDLGGFDEVRARLAEWRPIERARFGFVPLAILASTLGLWLFSLVASLSPPSLTVVLALFAVGPIALSRLVARSMMTNRQKARMHAMSIILLGWAALRVWLAWRR